MEKSGEENNGQSHMEHVFALIDSGHSVDRTLVDPKADEEE